MVLAWICCLQPGAAQGADLRASLQLLPPWKVQPATTPEAMPVAEDWGETANGSWRGQKGNIKPAAHWAGADPTGIHSLWFERELQIPAAWKEKEVVLDFRRIEGDAIVFVNGQRVAELLRPGGEVSLTGFVKYGETNALQVFVTRNYSGISRKYEEDLLRYSTRTRNRIAMKNWGLGITAPVTVSARPKQAVTDVFVMSSWREKKLAVQLEIAADIPLKNVRADATVFDAEGREVLAIHGPVPEKAGRLIHTIEASWANPKCWELDAPYLYTVKVKLTSDAGVLDEYPPVQFGFREIWAEGKQLMMNGHPSRWRLSEIYGANAAGLSVYQQIGYNVGQIQPHQNLWWQGGAETPIIDESLLETMDRTGMGCTFPAPSVSDVREKLADKRAREDYRRELDYFFKKYRNHPCILAWVVGMNSYCPTSNIAPDKLGIRESATKGQAKVIHEAVEMAHQCDPTRLAFAHADGSVGDVSSANVYLNFVPLQEREEWPLAWSANGNMPYSAVEFGAPFSSNYWKGKQFLITEYLAMYFGDQAYATETDAGLAAAVPYALLNKNGFGNWFKVDSRQYPCSRDFLRLFVKNTNRSWRTWGVNAGWGYWQIGERFGRPGPQKAVTSYEELNYNFLKEPLTAKPDWASPNWDIFQQANKPLLVYLAGWPVHTDKTHAYYAGETVRKQIATVWDGASPLSLRAKWELKQGERSVASGQVPLQLAPGEIRLTPLSIPLPKNLDHRGDYRLELTAMPDNSTEALTDSFPLEVFPAPAPLKSGSRIAVYDPQGKSAPGLKSLGLKVREWKPGDSLRQIDLLVLGREAIAPGEKLPYSASDVEKGLRVLVLEQTPAAWRSLGFETVETMPRYVFIRDHGNAVFKGLTDKDFINWRGAPDLLPEGKPAVSYDTPHAPKWTNRHAVASVALKTPQVVGFTPLLETEFDLAYSPLLEWRNGKGAIYFCSLDFTGRLNEDPAATAFAKNLLEALSGGPLPATKRVFFAGQKPQEEMLRAIGVEAARGIPSEDAAHSLLIAAGDLPEPEIPAMASYAQSGGQIFHLPQTGKALEGAGYQISGTSVQRVDAGMPSPLLRGIGPNLLRWQAPLALTVFTPQNSGQTLAGGVVLDRKTGKGREVFFQASPEMIAAEFAGQAEKMEAVQLSVLRLHRTTAQLLTNLGATPSWEVAQRLAVSTKAASVSALGSWKVLGPYKTDKWKGAEILNESYSAQYDAVRGAENPNATYKRSDGVMLDWRKTVEANHDGYVDVGKALDAVGIENIAYVTRSINSDRDQVATLQLGVDYWMQVWLNGTSLIKVDETHGMPVPNRFSVEAPLKAGKNIITLKVASGSNGFGFWCRLKTGQDENTETEAPSRSLYIQPFKTFDPYQFTYW